MKEVCCLLLLLAGKQENHPFISQQQGQGGVWANNEKTNGVMVTGVLDVSS